MINEKPLQIVRGALSGANVANCPHPCVAKPCGNGVQCIPIFDKYKCVCDKHCNSSDNGQVSFDGTSFVHYTSHEIQNRLDLRIPTVEYLRPTYIYVNI